MGERIKKLKKIRIHREGTSELIYGAVIAVAISAAFYFGLGAISPLVRHIVLPFVTGLLAVIWLMISRARCSIN